MQANPNSMPMQQQQFVGGPGQMEQQQFVQHGHHQMPPSAASGYLGGLGQGPQGQQLGPHMYGGYNNNNNAAAAGNPSMFSPAGIVPDGYHSHMGPRPLGSMDSPARPHYPAVARVSSPGMSSSPKPDHHHHHSKSPPLPIMSAVLSKPPKAPEKPLIPYLRFSKSVWENVKSDHPGMQFAEIGKIIGQQWRECPPDLKAKYTEDYLKDKEKYANTQKLYLESPEYQEWLRNKARIQHMEEEAEKAVKQADMHHQQHQTKVSTGPALSSHSRPPQHSHGPPQTGAFAQLLQGPLEELQSMSQRILPNKPLGNTAQFPSSHPPADVDDDADDFLRAKHVASTRYRRNHKLMAEVFSDTVVPDGRMIVNEQRITLLRKQVQSLAHHQDRLVAEQRDMLDKQVLKKQKLLEDSDAFELKWAAVKEDCKPVSKDQYCAMVDKYHKMFEKHVADYQAQQVALMRNQQEQLQKALEEQAPVLSLSLAHPPQEQPAPSQNGHGIVLLPPPVLLVDAAANQPFVEENRRRQFIFVGFPKFLAGSSQQSYSKYFNTSCFVYVGL